MNRAKKIYLLLGVLAAVCIATLAVTMTEDKKEQIKTKEQTILEIKTEDVTGLYWEYDDVSLAFHKDGSWIYDDDNAFPVDEEKIEDLLSEFTSFVTSFVIEDVEDYSQYGLDNPTCVINIEAGDVLYTVELGDFSTMDEQRYVSIGDGNVYLANHDPMDYFETVRDDLMKHDKLPDFENINRIVLGGNESYIINYTENSADSYNAEDVYFTTVNGQTVPLDTDNVEDYLDGISALNLTDYMTYSATSEDLSQYGFDNQELTITVEYTEDETEQSAVLYVNGIYKEETDEDGESVLDAAYVKVSDSDIIYKITEDEYLSLISYTYNDLRHKQILTADFADVYQVDITLEGESYTISSEEKDDKFVYYYGEEEIDITNLKNQISDLTASSFTDEAATGKEEISFTVYLDNENFPQVTVSLHRYDGTYCLAEVDGKPIALVERNQVVDIIEAVNSIIL